MLISSFPLFRQMDSFDCGATCLRMIAKYYGKNYRLNTLREYSYISRNGASLLGLSDAAEKIGFRTTGAKISLTYLKEKAILPCILHWKQGHYIVLYRIKRRFGKYKYYIADPASSLRILSEEEFISGWLSTSQDGTKRGIALILQPTTEFKHRTDEHEKMNDYNIRHFLPYLYPYKWYLVQTLICMVLYTLMGLVFPFLTQSVVDVGINNSNINFIIMILISQLILTFTDMGVRFLNSRISLHVNTRISLALLIDFWKKLMALPIRFFDTKKTGDLMQRLGDHERIRSFLMNDALGIIFSMLSFVLYTFLLAYYSLSILLIFFAGHFLYVAWILLFLRYRRELDFKAFEISSKDHSCVIQLIQGMQEIQINNCEIRKRWEWQEIQARYFENNLRALKIDQIKSFGAQFLSRSTMFIISFIIARDVINGQMTLGMMMALSYIMGQVSAPISSFIGFVHSFQDARISLERLNDIHNQQDSHQCVVSDLPQDSDLLLNHCSFSYNGSPREYVLKDIHLLIPQKKVTAIVGMSGCGKTTLMRLLQGVYQPQEGCVMIGNLKLDVINPHLWRSKIGVVAQDGYIFSDTIARNIAMGDDEIDIESLKNAVRIANIEDFIDKLPLGFNTKIGMEGNGISQGQRQRILIARAVYKNPQYLFFDEATNALDSNNEKIIMNNLSHFYHGKTVVISAHRLSTIRNADNIIVLNNGVVVEQGNHDELMAAKGEYYNLVRNQLETISE